MPGPCVARSGVSDYRRHLAYKSTPGLRPNTSSQGERNQIDAQNCLGSRDQPPLFSTRQCLKSWDRRFGGRHCIEICGRNNSCPVIRCRAVLKELRGDSV